MEKNGMTREIPSDLIKLAENEEESYNWADDMDELSESVYNKLKDSHADEPDPSLG